MQRLSQRNGWSLLHGPDGLILKGRRGAQARLAAIEAAHRKIRSPHVAPIRSRGRGWIAFGCDAVTDLGRIVHAAASNGIKVPYPEAIAFNEILMDTVEAAHRAPGGPWCLGELAWSSMLVDRQGHMTIFGFGFNFPTRAADGRLGPLAGACQAPEVLLGAGPTEASDVFCLHAMLRQLLPYADMPAPLTRAVQGFMDLVHLREALAGLSSRATAVDPAQRLPSIAALRAAYREIRAIAPGMPDPDFSGFARRLAGLVALVGGAPARPSMRVDRVARQVWLPDGRSIALQRRRALWAILAALLDAHAAAPDSAVSLDTLLERGWPSEKMSPQAGRARVYVAISSMRKLGLGDWIVKRDDGYLLAPLLVVE